MTNNCAEVADPELGQDQSEIQAETAETSDAKPSLAFRFEEILVQCKVEAECLDNLSWEELEKREKVARVLAAMGFISKGSRYRDCHTTAIPVDCMACGEKYFSRYRCTLRYCKYCGPWHFSRLMQKYREPIARLITEHSSQRGCTLATLDFTLRAYDRMPCHDEPRRLSRLVRHWFKRMSPEHTLWGCIFAVETGHELAVKH